jgi:CheY-specific phosphatase CheX
MDSAFITPFARSIEEVFSTTMQLFVRTDDPHGRARPALRDEVCAAVELTGDVAGTIRLCMSRATGQRLVQLFTGGPFDDRDFDDALGELAGMIAGRAKCRFPAGLTVWSSCPAVTAGPALSAPERICIPCSTDCGELALELSLKSRAGVLSAAA